MTHKPQHAHDLRALARLSTLALLLAQAWPAQAQLSQTPLINYPNTKPHPNFMVTLDDSGSMTHQYLPEGKFVVNGIALNFPADIRIYMHPSELSKNIYADRPLLPNVTALQKSTRFITAVPKESESTDLTVKSNRILQYQMRSPQVNTIYYNPAKKYKAWTGVRPDGTQTQFADASYTAAKLDPLALDPDSPIAPAELVKRNIDTSTVDLSQTQPLKTQWYKATPEPWLADDVLRTYNPALIYMLKDGADPTLPDSYDYYDLNEEKANVVYPHIYPIEDRPDCVSTVTTKATATSAAIGITTCPIAAERQNFANWFVFNRSRLFIAQGGFPDALNEFRPIFRLGWGTLRPGITFNANGVPPDDLPMPFKFYTVDGVKSETVQRGVREWTGQHKYDFTKWIRSLKTYGGTPTRQAVEAVTQYFQRTDSQSPWHSTEPDSNGVEKFTTDAPLSCRRSYNMVLTDGFYTPLATDSTRADLNADIKGDGIDANIYPFADAASNTLADFAMKGWLTDLQPNTAMPDQVEPIPGTPKTGRSQFSTTDEATLARIKSNPQTKQHLTQFMMGFGLTGNLLTQSVLTNPDVYDATLLKLSRCKDDSKAAEDRACWKDDLSDATTDKADLIDDLWHAAINSRGKYFKVNDKEDLTQAIIEALQNGGTDNFREGGLATSSTSMTVGNLKFVPEYKAIDWTGDLLAFVLDANGAVTGKKWAASAGVPAAANRNVYMWNGTQAVPFQYGTALGALANSILSEDLVNFIKGGKGNNSMRVRKSALPDFINSTPLYVRSGVDLGYGSSTSMAGASKYQAFLKGNGTSTSNSKAGRTDGLVLVGGNGGMLHAFSSNTGAEVFAYIPGASVSNLPKLAQVDYGTSANYHQYFVDGPLVESDVYLGSEANGAWHNIVVGTMGAGGKAMFALTLPTDNLSTGLTANTVRWEATHQDMGNITTTPQIGRLADGSWKVFVGNGFESSSGRAALLVIDVDTGQVESVPVPKVATNLPTAANRQPSAMGGVALAKSANNDTVQAIYAGDTDGRVWRFDVVNSTNGASVVQLGYRNEPLFTATDANTAGKPQPVVAAPLLYTHPQGGHMVLINTGRMSYDSDPTDTQLQSVYGLWDKQAATQDTSTIAAPGIDRSFLAHQRIKSRIDVEQVGAANTTAVSTPATSASDTASTTSSNSSSSETAPPKTRTFFDLSAESISWETQLGWLLDLDVPETTSANSSTIRPKAIYDPQRFSDRLVLFSAVQPGAQIASCVPTSNAMGYGFLVSALTGAQSALPSLDTDGNGTVTGADAIYSSYIYTGGGAQRVLIDEENKRQGSCLNALDSIRCEDPRTKRILDRIWRQLLNPPQPSAGTGSTETTSTVTGKDKTPAGTDTPVTSGTP